MEKYRKMQETLYERRASRWGVHSKAAKDEVVGCFDKHNGWNDYDVYLFKGVEDCSNKVALDFGCGPGRNIVKFWNKFKRIDGTDIAQNNLDKARVWIKHNGKSDEGVNLYKCSGVDLSEIPDNSYDVVFSTICMQHICCHSIRVNYLKEFFRVLKPGGSICIQMGYGPKTPRVNSYDYYTDFYDAPSTNGTHDTRVESPDQLKSDLEPIGYEKFEYDIRPVGPEDGHPNWIYFRARKL